MQHSNFTFKHYKEIFQIAINQGYKVVTCIDYFLNYQEYINDKILINRVDIDLSCIMAKKACEIFNELKIVSSFFVRLHAKEYNPFSFENYLCLEYIKDTGHEIGLHSEVIDCSKIWDEPPGYCLRKDLKILNTIFNFSDCINGVASHGGITGYNNLDFWKDSKPSQYELCYEAYDPILFNNFYTSDSLITKWKCYDKGVEIVGNNKCICEHLKDNHRVIYCVTHPSQYYERHVYEIE
jgi:hypothetical protein